MARVIKRPMVATSSFEELVAVISSAATTINDTETGATGRLIIVDPATNTSQKTATGRLGRYIEPDLQRSSMAFG